ncbi:MAG: rRNA pseudouridine synthase [Bdellovibrionaceae bacterium]|nr:rRNA pseudouridine synthase [Pseudobdellovibrionaceae bacterium]
MVTQNKIRLNKYIAQSGIASRRKADEMILEGQVKVNGKIATELGLQVDPQNDAIKVGNKLIKPVKELLYFKFNKPHSVLSTTSDPEKRKTVMDYFSGLNERVFPVGRLDWDSEGLLILTNDGDFSQKVTHPSEQIPKTYLVKISGEITEQKMQKLKTGVTIPGGRVRAIAVERLPNKETKYNWIKIIISEGKNRQIRFMMEKIGCDVMKLQRVAIGMLRLGKLKKGQIQQLSAEDVEKVFYKFKPEKIVPSNKKKKVHSFKGKKKKTKKTISKKEYFKKLNRKLST